MLVLPNSINQSKASFFVFYLSPPFLYFFPWFRVCACPLDRGRALEKTDSLRRRRRRRPNSHSMSLVFPPSGTYCNHFFFFACKAVEDSVISSSCAEVWKIDPSDGSLFVVTRRLPAPMESLLSKHARQQAERPSCRQLKVEVTAAELSPALAGGWVHRQADGGGTTPLHALTPPVVADDERAVRVFFFSSRRLPSSHVRSQHDDGRERRRRIAAHATLYALLQDKTGR